MKLYMRVFSLLFALVVLCSSVIVPLSVRSLAVVDDLSIAAVALWAAVSAGVVFTTCESASRCIDAFLDQCGDDLELFKTAAQDWLYNEYLIISSELVSLWDRMVTSVKEFFTDEDGSVVYDTSIGTGFNTSGTLDQAKAFWKNVDIYTLFNSDVNGMLFTVYQQNYYGGLFRWVSSKRSTHPIICPAYVTSLSPYTAANCSFGQLVSGYTAYSAYWDDFVYCNYADAYADWQTTGKDCYFLTPDTYFVPFDGSSSYYDVGYFYSLGYLQANGSVRYDWSKSLYWTKGSSSHSITALCPNYIDQSANYSYKPDVDVGTEITEITIIAPMLPNKSSEEFNGDDDIPWVPLKPYKQIIENGKSDDDKKQQSDPNTDQTELLEKIYEAIKNPSAVDDEVIGDRFDTSLSNWWANAWQSIKDFFGGGGNGGGSGGSDAEASGGEYADQLVGMIPDPSSDVIAALGNLVDVLQYDGTSAVLTTPAITLPYINGVCTSTELLGSQKIDFEAAVDTYVPGVIMSLIRALFDVAIVGFCLKEFMGLIGSLANGAKSAEKEGV